MKIEVDKQPECCATAKVEIPAEKVAAERKELAKGFAKQAKLPGYRPGKVPASVIEKRFKKEIDEEFEGRIIGEAIRETAEQENLKILSVTAVEEKNYNVDGTFSFTAEITTAPEFQLPEYKGIAVQVPELNVTPEDVERGLEQVREQFADYDDIGDRGAEMGDFIVINYKGTVDGKPIGEVAPEAPAQVATGEEKWFKMEEKTFVPGFCDGLVGAKPTETREVTITMPEDFPNEALANKEIVYSVELNGLKAQVLPELDDDLAEKIKPDTTMDELRELMEADILKQREGQIEKSTTQQIINQLNANLEFELPKDMVKNEAQSRINDIVRENAQRGLGDEAIAEHQDEILQSATATAHDSVKNTFILEKIAEEEELKVDNDELKAHVEQMAENYGMPFKKLAQQLEKEGQVNQIHHQLLMTKTLDFLKSNASVEILSDEQLQAAAGAQ